MSMAQGRLPIASDFENISLFDPKDAKKWRAQRDSQSSQDSASSEGSQMDDTHNSLASNLSTPTLVSDTSSLRSSVCSASSPIVGHHSLSHTLAIANATVEQHSTHATHATHGASPVSGLPSALHHHSSQHQHQHQQQHQQQQQQQHNLEPSEQGKTYSRRRSVPALIDNTSMASLTIKNQSSSRTRKQRELEFEADQDDDIWPGDTLMFNVPMSPALYAQQRQKQQQQQQQHGHGHGQHHFGGGSIPSSSSASSIMSRKRGSAPDLSIGHKSGKNSFNPPPSAAAAAPLHSQSSINLAPPPRRSSGLSQVTSSLPSIHESGAPSSSTRKASVESNVSSASTATATSASSIPIENYRHRSLENPSRINSLTSLPSLMSRRGSCMSEPNTSIEGLDPDASDLTLEFYEQEQNRERDGRVSIASLSMMADDTTPLPSPVIRDSEDSDRSSRRSSLTRPENLPPKTPEEEHKHLKEYEKLLKDAAAAEKRKQQKQEEERKLRAYQTKQDAATWSHWLAKGGKSKLSSDIKWRGIPEKLRGTLWLHMLCRTSSVGGVTGTPAHMPQPNTSFRKEIVRDSELLWPDCCIFGKNRPLHDSLIYVVEQFLALHTEIQYSFQLMGIAALMLLYLSESESVTAMSTLIRPQTLLHSVLSGNERLASASYVSFGKIFRRLFERLSEHFAKVNLDDSELLNPMIAGIFTTVLPSPEAAARIVDVFIFDGDSFLLRAALGILRCNEAWLYDSKSEILNHLQNARQISDDDLMRCIRNVTKH